MPVRIYPVTGKELRHDGYEVKVNGKPVERNYTIGVNFKLTHTR